MEGQLAIPKTQTARIRWSMLDRFVEALADAGDRVCEAPPEDRYFEEMQRLLCRGDVSVVPRHAPYYHYVFTAFYALFHRDVRLAEAVIKILAEAGDELASGDDVQAVRVLSAAVQAVKSADCNSPEVFRAQLKTAAEIIRAGGEAGSWSHLFRDLVAAYLDPAAEAANSIKKTVEEILREARETAEAYGIPGPEEGATPLLYFIYKMADRLEKEGYDPFNICVKTR